MDTDGMDMDDINSGMMYDENSVDIINKWDEFVHKTAHYHQ
ncbi:20797_t:CDS:2 [Dentiscutata erythropus]|uniref:20797_t:CDS:1 n=1 Tax=Dentiscutata erythropus TaxID=1348616 RepID=A0A9N8ZRY1_9GLOM|nr:20797_t:CDS:2 [Dentiscutata erythropus]